MEIPDGDTLDATRKGCLVGFLLGIVGIALRLLSMPGSIGDPFSGEWDITGSAGSPVPPSE